MAGIVATVGSLAAAGVSAYGTIASGKASSSAATAEAKAAAKYAIQTSEAESRSAEISSTATATQAIMSAVAQAQALGDQIPILQMRAENEAFAGDVRGVALEHEGKEELAQSSVNMLQYRRFKNLAHSKLTNTAAASGFTATDATAMRIGDDIETQGSVQESTEIRGGLIRSAALRAAGAAERYYGSSASLASLMEADALRKSGLSALEAGDYSSKVALSAGKAASAQAEAAGYQTAANYYKSGQAKADAYKTSSYTDALSTILSGVSNFSTNYSKYWGKTT